MQPYQQRVIEEKQELDEKRERLAAFINASDSDAKAAYLGLPVRDQALLEMQLVAMTNYSDILEERIERFDDD